MINTPAPVPPSSPSYGDRIVMEIVDTERSYVKDLEEIIDGYLKYMRCMTKSEKSEKSNINSNNNNPSSKNNNSNNNINCSLSCSQVEDFFGNLEDVYNFSKTFLNQLEKCGLDPTAVAKCFLQNATGFEVYAHYCAIQYPKMLLLMNEGIMKTKETADLLRERQVALSHSLPLSCYLLKPVQRFLKYPLLLQNLLKHYENNATEVQDALTVVINYAYYINDKKREVEQSTVRRNLAMKGCKKKKEFNTQIQVPLKKAIRYLINLISYPKRKCKTAKQQIIPAPAPTTTAAT